jgi:C4-dicarboxylate-specific signal transduction histidine kinase
VAHELNQPLAATLSNAQAASRFLEAKRPDLEQIRECLTDIVADDMRAGEVIKRLRTLLKKDGVQASIVDLNEVVGDVIRLIRNDALLRGVSVVFEPTSGLPPVLGDCIQLYQVVLNLAVNGLEATGSSHRTPAQKTEGGGVWQIFATRTYTSRFAFKTRSPRRVASPAEVVRTTRWQIDGRTICLCTTTKDVAR